MSISVENEELEPKHDGLDCQVCARDSTKMIDEEPSYEIKEIPKSGRFQNLVYGEELIVHQRNGSRKSLQLLEFGKDEAGVPTTRRLTFVVAHASEKNGEWELRPAAHRWTQEIRDIEAVIQFLSKRASKRFMLLDLDSGKNSAMAVAKLLDRLKGSQALSQLVEALNSDDSLLQNVKTAVRVRELRDAIEDLESMLETDVRGEANYQAWCDKHTWAFGNAYVMKDESRNIGDGDQIDLMLQEAATGYRDIIELKTPKPEILLWDKVHLDWYFSSDVSQAVGQCHRYLDNLHRKVDVSGLTNRPELRDYCYNPRATIVIGRSNDWERAKHQGLRGLNSRLHGIQVMTFDYLLERAKASLASVDVD